MTRKKKKKKETEIKKFLSIDVLFFLQLFIGVVLFFSIYGHQLMGPFGKYIQKAGFFLFSDTLPLLPWLLFFTSVSLIMNKNQHIRAYLVKLIIMTVLFLTFIDSFFTDKLILTHGQLRWSLTESINLYGSKAFGHFGIRLVCLSVALILLVSLFNITLDQLRMRKRLYPLLKRFFSNLKYQLFYTKKTYSKKSFNLKKKQNTLKMMKDDNPSQKPPPIRHSQPIDQSKLMVNAQKEEFVPITNTNTDGYVLPPVDLLVKSKKINSKEIEADMREKSRALEMTLGSFNVDAKVINITIGPTVSRFELQPGEGVKISKITNLTQDIALKLAVPTVRIEAPIPGKALIGIEIPNSDVSVLTLRSIIGNSNFFGSNNLLDCVLGQTITGESVTMALNKMPHILVAGSTGSGKSVCVNAIILSILLKARPDEVRFLMIDPKKVELSLYSDIPHLLAPVVTNPNKAAATLKQWALVEMERRYEVFTEHGVKDLAGYNNYANKSEDPTIESMPHIVVIIDEFADLMMVASQEVENTICRLAQMARATGIHLVIATQRPSVNVVTGLIKANIPSRLSFAVQSQIDSRTILDMAGAEKLLGKGDMLYMPIGASKPVRIQGVFVSEKEVNALVSFIKKQAVPEYVNDIINVEPLEEKGANNTDDNGDKKDDLFDQARELIQSTQYASTSYLQRKLRIGYNRAARLMDELEEEGVISNYDGDNKTRTVLPS